MTPAEAMREAAADWVLTRAWLKSPGVLHSKTVSEAISEGIRALPLPVDVNETALFEHQTGVMLTDAPQRPADPVMEAMARALWVAIDALADSQWSGGSAERRCVAALAEYKAWKGAK